MLIKFVHYNNDVDYSVMNTKDQIEFWIIFLLYVIFIYKYFNNIIVNKFFYDKEFIFFNRKHQVTNNLNQNVYKFIKTIFGISYNTITNNNSYINKNEQIYLLFTLQALDYQKKQIKDFFSAKGN